MNGSLLVGRCQFKSISTWMWVFRSHFGPVLESPRCLENLVNHLLIIRQKGFCSSCSQTHSHIRLLRKVETLFRVTRCHFLLQCQIQVHDLSVSVWAPFPEFFKIYLGLFICLLPLNASISACICVCRTQIMSFKGRK